jgi:hypothetical protein
VFDAHLKQHAADLEALTARRLPHLQQLADVAGTLLSTQTWSADAVSACEAFYAAYERFRDEVASLDGICTSRISSSCWSSMQH